MRPRHLYLAQFTTIEYTLTDVPPAMAPAYVFVIDTAQTEDELAACRAALTRTLQNIHEYAQVCSCGNLRRFQLPASRYAIINPAGRPQSVQPDDADPLWVGWITNARKLLACQRQRSHLNMVTSALPWL